MTSPATVHFAPRPAQSDQPHPGEEPTQYDTDTGPDDTEPGRVVVTLDDLHKEENWFLLMMEIEARMKWYTHTRGNTRPGAPLAVCHLCKIIECDSIYPLVTIDKISKLAQKVCRHAMSIDGFNHLYRWMITGVATERSFSLDLVLDGIHDVHAGFSGSVHTQMMEWKGLTEIGRELKCRSTHLMKCGPTRIMYPDLQMIDKTSHARLLVIDCVVDTTESEGPVSVERIRRIANNYFECTTEGSESPPVALFHFCIETRTGSAGVWCRDPSGKITCTEFIVFGRFLGLSTCDTWMVEIDGGLPPPSDDTIRICTNDSDRWPMCSLDDHAWYPSRPTVNMQINGLSGDESTMTIPIDLETATEQIFKLSDDGWR